ncbi:hypothetical protein [Amycolatopsis sp. NPDC059021]|uniref:hypothetical protein n=1 Tax=Amycolatopsis sp. NPDC059021 TaxID=3346704 RepID=UPI00366E2362
MQPSHVHVRVPPDIAAKTAKTFSILGGPSMILGLALAAAVPALGYAFPTTTQPMRAITAALGAVNGMCLLGSGAALLLGAQSISDGYFDVARSGPALRFLHWTHVGALFSVILMTTFSTMSLNTAVPAYPKDAAVGFLPATALYLVPPFAGGILAAINGVAGRRLLNPARWNKYHR